MSTRSRDSANNVASKPKTKENIPLATSSVPASRLGRPFVPSLAKSPDKQPEFFTESFLGDNASRSSLIPSPLPTSKSPLSKPRRSVQSIAKPKLRPAKSEPSKPRPDDLSKSHRKHSARTSSPIHSIGLSTPPRSREGSFVGSPIDLPSSPPPALTETYHRIDQEEDLAATEGEISDRDSDRSDKENLPLPNAQLPLQVASNESLRRLQPLRAATPTNDIPSRRTRDPRNNDLTAQSVFSDPTGMSFVDQISDPNIRNTLTPHFQQSALDREALEKVWRSKKPIAFSRASQGLFDADNIADSVASSPRVQPDRVIAFSKAGKVKLASDHLFRPQHHRTFSDVTEQVDRSSNQPPRPHHNDNWHNDDLRREAMPHNPRVHRQPYFVKNHGFPDRNIVGQIDQVETNGIAGSNQKAHSESPFTFPSNQLEYGHSKQDDLGQHNQYAKASKIVPEPDLTLNTQDVTQASTDVWAQEAADHPVQSIENDLDSLDRNQLSEIRRIHSSPEKSRRFDIDFTGQSFQVSESPPLRTKNMVQDFQRDREIRGLERRAVTTNRLSQLRARESQERLRQGSKSPVSEIDERPLAGSHVNGSTTPTSSATVRRTSSNGSMSKFSNNPLTRPEMDRSTSHEILQRLARGSSSTPRSSTPSDKVVDIAAGGSVAEEKAQTVPTKETDETKSEMRYEDNIHRNPSVHNSIKATPKVVGAWTDTILPDTIKTTKRPAQHTRYAQTPHVSAGGWVDTPAVDGAPVRLEPVPEVSQEIPEELMNGIVKDSAEEKTLLPEVVSKKDTNTGSAAAPIQAPESLAQKVLNEAKEKLEVHVGSAGDNLDDSLVLGNATIQSLENFLDADLTDLTIVSRLGTESDTQVLDRLGTKLDRLRHNIHDAKKGLSKLEHQISHPEQSTQISENPTAALEQLPTPTSLPFGILTLSIPFPMVFHPRRDGQRLQRPTPFGWIVLSFLCWYFLECLLGEIYSHPVYAEQYTWPTRSEPEFPFVLPTMLWRWTRMEGLDSWLIVPLRHLIVGFTRLVGIWLGWIDGFTNGPAGADTVDVGTQVPTQAAGFDMMHDEFL